jgi:hypothetical protein
MRTLIVSALFIFSLSADAQILSPEPYDRDRSNGDPYYQDDRDQRDSRDDPYYRDKPYYRGDRDVRGRRRERQRDRRQDDYDYGRQAPYGLGRDPLEVVNRIMSDVRMVASNNYSIEKHDRKHFEEVEEELGKFTRKYREGKFDKNNLKDAAESLEHLALSNSITSSHDRRIIRYALNTVQDLRSGRYDVNTRSRTDDRRLDLGNR